MAKGLFIRVSRLGEGADRFGCELFVAFLARAPAAHQINGRIVAKPEQKGALVSHSVQESRLARQLDEQFLNHIASVGFVPRKVQQKGEEGLGVNVVEAFEIKFGRHSSLA
jgi:hypothetical protein